MVSPATGDEKKTERLIRLETLLLSSVTGMTRAEIARTLGVHRSTAGRYVDDLSRAVPIIEEENGTLKIDRDSYVSNIRLSFHETLSLHFAARYMVRRFNYHYPYAASALRKLGVSLERIAPRLSSHIIQSAEEMEHAPFAPDEEFTRVVELLNHAWTRMQLVSIIYPSKSEGSDKEYLFGPYFIEPYPDGHTVYVLGISRNDEELRLFRVDKIKHIELTDFPYMLPKEFSGEKYFADAWGIWLSNDGSTKKVVLQFSPLVAERVKKTIWHKSQAIKDLANGGVRWTASIAEPQEMFPWIRGWGKEVEILEPKYLRDQYVSQLKALSDMYEIL
jgi:CRISPR-associated endonuclease/helicase Cas3